jgi:hypothetical protein
VFILPLKLGKVDDKTTSEDNDLRRGTSLSRNSVLKTYSQVTEAKKHLKALNLFLHHDKSKSWDTYKMIEMLSKADRNSFILDVGCNDSPILPMLKRLGFRNLYGCDLVLKPRYSRNFMNAAYSLYKREYKPIVEMHNDKASKPLNTEFRGN